MVWQGWKKEERVLVLAGEWWITFALALLSRLHHLSLHFLIKTAVSGGLRHLKSVSRMVSRSCQVDQQVKLLCKSRWKPWCAARLCVSRIQTQLLLFGSRGGGSLKTSSPINLAPPSSYVTFCHITEQPASTNTLLPFCPRADLMYTQQVFKREREIWNTSNRWWNPIKDSPVSFRSYSTQVVWIANTSRLKGIPALPCRPPLALGLPD